MGKDLKGKELGKNLSQEKGGCYVARFTDKFGIRQSKRFKKLQEARKWLADSTYLDEHSNMNAPQSMTVDSFFEFWIETKAKMSKNSTAEAYTIRYYKNIQPEIGSKKITDIKLVQCQMIINKMIDAGYGNSTISLTCSVLRGLFDYAVECDIIMKNPCNIKMKKTVGKPKKDREALTKTEQMLFLKALEGNVYENQFRFILQTGLRIGELIGLKWEDVDFKNRTIKIRRAMKYSESKKEWRIETPKSDAGYRTISLTDEAVGILKRQQKKNASNKVIELDSRDYVFISNKGTHISVSTYDSALVRICKMANIKKFSVHILRHTFATRCIEAGMKPKTLQTIMGHSSIGITMNLYVHTTDEEMFNEMAMVSQALQFG